MWARGSWSDKLLAAVVFLLSACATPKQGVEATAAALHLGKASVRSEGFTLTIFRNHITQPTSALHVYLEGDGTPWVTRTRIAADPTPRNPVALRLMALDPAPALYLGRPCYNGRHVAAGCTARLWTSGRYSEVVISSMSAALRKVIAEQAVDEINLIGYSGGGVIAWALAQRIPEVRGLVTIAANLDIDIWADLHRYSRLSDSVNPATGPPMREGVRQLHIVGTNDSNVPPAITSSLSTRLGSNARVVEVAADHRCCWEEVWPAMLAVAF